MSLPLVPEDHIVVFNDWTIRRVFIDVALKYAQANGLGGIISIIF